MLAMNNKFIHNKRLDPVKVKHRQLELRKLEKPYKNVDICKLTGISPVQVCIHINGRARNNTIQQAIADFLGVPLNTLLDKSQESRGLKAKREGRASRSAPGSSATSLAAVGSE